MTFVLGLLLLACTVFSKVCVISLSERMIDDNTTPQEATLVFVMLQIIAVVPHVISFTRASFKIAFRQLPWPKPKQTCVVSAYLYCVILNFYNFLPVNEIKYFIKGYFSYTSFQSANFDRCRLVFYITRRNERGFNIKT